METIFRRGIYNILKIFYENRNSKVHLRELARKTKLNENSISRFVNELTDYGVLLSFKEDSVRKFCVSAKFLGAIFSIFDFVKLNSLPFDRKKSIEDYINQLKVKPYCLILFGSSARDQAKQDSDLDLLEITDSKIKSPNLLKNIESERGIRLQVIKLNLVDFTKAILEEDAVILSALNNGFPVFGKDFFYEVIKHE